MSTLVRFAALALTLAFSDGERGRPEVGQDQSPPGRVRALAEAGRLAEAEQAARAGGPALSVPLGEILALRGKLAPAESVFTAAVRGRLPGHRSAEAALAELAARRGDRALARQRAEALAAAYERSGGQGWSAEDLTAAGRAWVILGADDPEGARAALRAFDAAIAADSAATEPRVRLGDLFLDRYNAPEALASYEGALTRAPNHPRVLLGLARVLAFEGKGDAFEAVRRSLAANPSLVPAQVQLGALHLDAEAHDSAAAAGGRALAVDSTDLTAWALRGAAAWFRDDTAGFAEAERGARRAHPRPAEFYAALGEWAARHRRYAEAVRFGREATALDPDSPRALGVLGINELRIGAMDSGRVHLERAFARDPFHVWYKNTLDLLDELRGFRTVRAGRFEIVAPAAEADLLALYLGPLLEEAYDSLASRYEYRPPPPVRIELYRRSADFSVRTAGLTGLGALGVSFGTVLAMDAPSAREPGSFNWGSTAWHELAHTFTLGASNHRVPRWLSEGLSVLEERRARPGWGDGPSVPFLAALKGDRLLPLPRLNEGFVRPRYPAEVQFSYYAASLACEMIEERWGRKAFVAMLRAYRDGRSTPGVFQTALGLDEEALGRQFAGWIQRRFAGPLAAVAPWDGRSRPTGELVNLIREGRNLLESGQIGEAQRQLERAAALFPEYTGEAAPLLLLARLHAQRGNDRAAADALARYTAQDGSSLGANLMEAEVRERLGDLAGARGALMRVIWIAPYDPVLHERLAGLAERLGDWRMAVRERRAVLTTGPADRMEARYQVARALARAGDTAAARREILEVLESAPRFEKAQALLLELSGRRP
ncbi:MAG: hypothetical protein ACT4PM_06000 [Gemmatimonadales bacterium]